MSETLKHLPGLGAPLQPPELPAEVPELFTSDDIDQMAKAFEVSLVGYRNSGMSPADALRAAVRESAMLALRLAAVNLDVR